MTPLLRVLVVAHTHWDREWYRSAGRFRQRLVALVDELLDDPPPPGESFLLDGQTIVLEDYLAVRPERAAELVSLLRSGRIEAGPWYVLADELIPSGEALVRNLLAGREALRAMRAESPPVLYCPDAFGHPAILPDLAAGFGCELVVTWRGYGGARSPAGDSVRWRGAAGAEVLMHHLPPDGYEFGSSLPLDATGAATRWARIDATLRPRATLGVALLLNGADHHARQRGQSEAVRALATAATPTVLTPATLRSVSEELTRAASGHSLPEISGELRDSYGYTWTLQGTLASRAMQKRRNATLERALTRDTEPWLALGDEGAGARSRALLRAAWRTLLAGHPHDTLCGTSIDDVAAALDARHLDVEGQVAGLRTDAIAALIGHEAEAARAAQSSWLPAVVVRNRAPRRRGGVVELSLSATLADVAVGPGSATKQGARRTIAPWQVEGMPVQVLERGERVELTESPRAYPDADLVASVRAVGWVHEIGGYSAETIAQLSGPLAAPDEKIPNPVRADRDTLENGLVALSVSADGAVRIVDTATGRVIVNALTFEDHVDVGDLYTPAIRDALPELTMRRARVVHRGPIRGTIEIEYRRASARSEARAGSRSSAGVKAGAVRLLVTLSLDANARFVRIRIDGQNAARDHRLRAIIATGLSDATTIADAAFRSVRREPLSISAIDAEMERVVATAPLHRYVSRYARSAGATIFSDGLAEYESLYDGSVAITLVRAVGALSRHDLPERPGHAGWPADTPLAQSEGPFAAELALAVHGPDSPQQRDAVEQMCDDVLLPLVGETLRSNRADPHAAGGLELVGEGLAFSAAMPASETGWIALRCVNRRDHAVEGEWRVASVVTEAAYARLDETIVAPIPSAGSTISFTAPPYAIVTILAHVAS